MTPETFLENFGAVANAPGGIERLRQLILQLAMQGRLTVQEAEQDAEELLEQVSIEKKRLVSDQLIGKQKEHLPLANSDIPYKIPSIWSWVRFGKISHHNAGKTLDKGRNSGSSRPYITTSNLYWGRFDLTNVREMPIRDEELLKCQVQKGDLLICEGGEAGRAAVWNFDSKICIQNHIHRAWFYCGIDPYFYYLFFLMLNLSNEISKYRKGVGISSMSGKVLSSIPVPLPPLEEQKRIVAKVDQLMALCDRLEAQQKERAALIKNTRTSALDALANAKTPNDLKTAWQRVEQNISILFDAPKDVEDLKKCILQNAVMGKLVPQDPNDEPASELLKKIAAEKAELIKQKKLKKTRPVPESRKIKGFDQLPKGWSLFFPDEFCASEMHALAIGPFGSNLLKSDYRDSGVPLVFVRNIRARSFGDSTTKYVKKEKAKELSAHSIKPGDLLITKMGAPPGDTAIYPPSCPTAIITADCIKVSLHQAVCDLRYFKYAYVSPLMKNLILDETMGVAHQKISLKRFRSIPVPFPSLEEQIRIADKIEQLFSLCDKLQQQLTTSRKIAEQLAQSTVESITGISTEKKEKMKAPKTELIT